MISLPFSLISSHFQFKRGWQSLSSSAASKAAYIIIIIYHSFNKLVRLLGYHHHKLFILWQCDVTWYAMMIWRFLIITLIWFDKYGLSYNHGVLVTTFDFVHDGTFGLIYNRIMCNGQNSKMFRFLGRNRILTAMLPNILINTLKYM